jgi:SSS family solute:Na+ symporter
VPIVIGVIAAFFIINAILIRIFHSPQKDMDTYTVGNRKMPWFMIAFGYMGGWYVGSVYTGFAGNSADIGFFAQYLAVYSLSSLIVLYLMARPVWVWGKVYGLESGPEYVGLRYNSVGFQKFWAIFMILVDGCWLIMEFVTLGYVVQVATNGWISFELGIVISGVFCGFYTVFGGVKDSAVASVIQGIIFIIIGSVVFLILQFKTYGGFTPLFDMVAAHKPALLELEGGTKTLWITSIITGTLGAICWPNSFLRLFMGSSPREDKKSLFFSPICAIVVVLLILMPTMGGRLLTGFPEDAQYGLFWIANEYGGPIILGAVAVFTICAALTTISTVANAISVPFAKDIVRVFFKKTDVLKLAKLTTAIVTVVAILLGTRNVPQLNFFAIMLYNFIVQAFVPQIIGTFFKRGNKIGAIAGMAVGCIVAVIYQFWPTVFGDLGAWAVLLGLLANTIVFIVCGFVFGKPDHVDKLYENLRLYDNNGKYCDADESRGEKIRQDWLEKRIYS